MIYVDGAAIIDTSSLSFTDRLDIMKLFSYKQKGKKERFTNYYYDSDTKILRIPPNKRKLDYISSKFDLPIVYATSNYESLNEPFKETGAFTPRAHQSEPIEALIKSAKHDKFTTISAGCGTGKSWVMSYVAGQLGEKVLILVDQSNLIPNFNDAVSCIYDKPIQKLSANTDKFDDVCICTFQLLARDDNGLLDRIKNVFGVCCVDESHTIKCETFKFVLSNLNNKYRISCSATFYIKSLPVDVLEDWLAPVAVTMVDHTALKCLVKVVPTGTTWCSTKPMDFTTICTQLAEDVMRNAIVIDELIRALDVGRKILVIAISNDQVEYVHNALTSKGYRSRKYVGTTTTKADNALREDFANDLLDIVITIKKAEKGLDIPILDVVAIVKPNNNEGTTTQICGRARRPLEGKPKPVVIEFRDNGSLADTFFFNRCRWYKDLGFKVIDKK